MKISLVHRTIAITMIWAGAASAIPAAAADADMASLSIPPAVGTVLERRTGGEAGGTVLIIRHQQVQGLLHDYAGMVGRLCALPPLAGSRAPLVVISSDRDLRKQLAAFRKLPTHVVQDDAAAEDAFARLQNNIRGNLGTAARIKDIVNAIRRECLPGPLARLLSKTDDFESGLLTPDDYAVFLAQQCKKEQIPLAPFPNVRMVLRVRQLEGDIEPARAEAEKDRLLHNVLPRLVAADRARLVEAADAVAAGKLAKSAYYQMLRSYASRAGFSLSPYRHLRRYTAYLSESAGLRRHAVRAESERIAAQIESRYRAEAAGDDALPMRMTANYAALLRVIRPAPTPGDIARFLAEKERYRADRFIAFYDTEAGRMLAKPSLPVRDVLEITLMDGSLDRVKKFFECIPEIEQYAHDCRMRNEQLTGQVFSLLKDGSGARAVIIADDAFLPPILRGLGEIGVNYAVISPSIPDPNREDLYPPTMILKGR